MKKVVSIFIFAVISVIVNAQNEIKNFKTLEFDYMDLSVEPSDDFYQYATGTWMKNNPVPEEESRWSSFNQLSERIMKQMIYHLKALMKSSLNHEKTGHGVILGVATPT